MLMSEKVNKLLVLDLDETLIHATKTKLDNLLVDFTFDEYYIYKRPHLEHFLIQAAKYFKLAIWSSAGDIYVNEIVAAIKPAAIAFEVVWARAKCSMKRDRIFDSYYFEKRLDKFKKRGFLLEQILIVDDTAEKATCNYGNAIYSKEYKGNADDKELLRLLEYLLTLKDVENVRTIEKRYWRTIQSGT